MISLLRRVAKNVQDVEKGVIELLLAYIYFSKEDYGKSVVSLFKSYEYIQHENILNEVNSCIHYWLDSDQRNYTQFIDVSTKVARLIEQSNEFKFILKNIF